MNQAQEILHLQNLEYEQRRPENSVLYKTVQQHYKTVLDSLSQQKTVPYFIEKEFSGFLKCGILSAGFTRIHCQSCNHNKLLPFSCKLRGCCPLCRFQHKGHYAYSRIMPTNQISFTILV